MLCEPTSRPQSPFLMSSPHIHHPQPQRQQLPLQQQFNVHSSPGLSRPSNPSYPSYPTPSSSGYNPSQPTPIPHLSSAQYPNHHHSQIQNHTQQQYTVGQSLSMPPTPFSVSPSSSSRPSIPHRMTSTGAVAGPSTSTATSRPNKPLKKSSGSTNQKQKNVQMSLELKVEKAKGFHAFFVPLCKNLPPAPPCSPVNGHGHGHGHHIPKKGHQQHQQLHQADNIAMSNELDLGLDYFGSWNKSRAHDTWVEDISNSLSHVHNHGDGRTGDGMEVDAH
ncbi:uncharacterized protein I303_105106 [Kwoniella dejecticola CBS 10117]|uniref:Uncharacterized protein n=1 Tax=Kwoniella dejecticola CBS 10117 TaxID=1296121 RepID=A0A1A6A3F2_9TREE|nr:uncharacterized protein I303_05449 [Kwoniella dejecticola CBS 10117]OBR84590.1 hypothetical protein I303_05449 [Kwoniella dejecticola CBS 10117]